MSKQRIIKDEIWSDEWFFSLDTDAKLLWFFLLTNERNNIAGIYKLSPSWLQAVTGLKSDKYEEIMATFEEDNKIHRFNDWVVVVNHVKHQSINPSVEQGIKRVCATVPMDVIDSLSQAVPACPTLLYLTLPISDKSQKMKKNKLGRYSEDGHNDYETAIDIDSGEEIADSFDEQEKVNKKVTELIEWAEGVRGKPFMDRPTQRKFIHDLRTKNIHPDDIKATYLELLGSDYWRAQKALPDFKSVFSNIKNRK